MFKRIVACVSTIVVSACLGCGASDRAELEKVKAELAEARAELKSLKSEKKQGYLDELERLEALRAKNVITQEEFETKKKAALSTSSKPEQSPSSMDELAKQFRTIQTLWNNNTITAPERDQKKLQLINGPIVLEDLKKDLETVQKLWNENVITATERDALKKRLLEMEPMRK
jgi:hypothetical protein